MPELISIIILDSYEKPIAWLDSELTEIVETRKMDEPRSISITYPLGVYSEQDSKEWFKQGNKIFVPSTLGIDSCLYIINTSYDIDFWEQNRVTFTCEEVLVELNNVPYYYTGKDPIKVDYDFLNEVFGDFYDINPNIKIPSTNNKIQPKGSMTKMELLRLIEDTTGLYTITDYTTNNNQIIRTLDLVELEDAGKIWDNQFLDLNDNLDSLEFNVDESDTYSAMFPKMTIQESTDETTETTETTTTSNSSGKSVTKQQISTIDDLDSLMNEWLDFEVEHRSYIPMIVQKTQSEIKYTAYWYAPFPKVKGEIFIGNPLYTETNYKNIIPYKRMEKNLNTLPKMGSVTTTETEMYALYNTLANKLLDKRNPNYTLKISLKDLQTILPEGSSLGYSLYDTLFVKAPNFSDFIPVTIIETKKNPHLQGDNTITVQSNITEKYCLYESFITTYNQIIGSSEEVANVGGVLTGEEGEFIKDGTVLINIHLEKGYGESDVYDVIEHVKEFKPESEFYEFSKDEILNMEKVVRNTIINSGSYPSSVNMKDIKGQIYRVPWDWVRSIYYSYNQIYIISDYGTNLGKGKWAETIALTPITDAKLVESYNNNRLYYDHYCSWFYYNIQKQKTWMWNKGFSSPTDVISSFDAQTGDDCVAAAISNVTEVLWMYHTESECAKLLKTKTNGGGTPTINVPKYVPKWDLVVTTVELTMDNLIKYVNDPRSSIEMNIWCSETPYYQKYSSEDNVSGTYMNGHGVHIKWAGKNSSGQNYVYIEDSNFPLLDPAFRYGLTKSGISLNIEDYFLSFDQLYAAAKMTKTTKGDICDYKPGYQTNGKKYFFAITLTDKNIASNVINHSCSVDKELNRKLIEYKFTLSEVKSAFKELYQLLNSNPRWIPDTMTVEITDSKKNTYYVDGKMIKALAYSLHYTNNNSWKKISNPTAIVNEDTNWYYEKLNNNTIIPCNYYKKNMEIYYTLSDILFFFGMIEFPYNIYSTYSDLNYNFTNITSALKGISKNHIPLGFKIVNRTEANIKKILNYNNGKGEPLLYILSFVKSSIIDSKISTDNTTYHPILLYKVNNTEINYIIPQINDINPKNETITNSPYNNMTTNQYLEMTADYDTYTNSEDRNKILVIGLSQNIVEEVL